MSAKKTDISPGEAYQTFMDNRGNHRATARDLSIGRTRLKALLNEAAEQGMDYGKPISGGAFKPVKAKVMPLPKSGEVKRYILTAAQNNTDLNLPFFENLVAYSEFLGAELKIARFTYNKGSWGRKSVKPGSEPTREDKEPLWFDPLIANYIDDRRLELAPMLIWCGEANILPTAKRPLSGLETYTGRKSSIFPHTKIALESIPSTRDDEPKFTYTTGAVTLLNYIQKKAGLQAEFHHSFGATLVEVDADGDWFVRQLNATTDGTFYDVPSSDFGSGSVVVKDGVVSEGMVEGVTWGDLHAEIIDEEQRAMAFDAGGILDTLKPRHQFLHDILDFQARSHHEMKNPHQMFKYHVGGRASVRDAVSKVAALVQQIERPETMTVVVKGNHDDHLTRWLREADYRHDPLNAEFFLDCQLRVYRGIRKEIEQGATSPDILRDVLRDMGVAATTVFLGPDDSFVLCDDESGGVENGMHGDRGPNGSRGTPLGLSKMGRKATTAHTHSVSIIDGLYVAGTMSILRPDYAKGPSSWSHSFVVTYPNGKRAIVTTYNGKWRG